MCPTVGSSHVRPTVTIPAIQALFQKLNPEFPNFNLVTFSASMKPLKPADTETKTKASASSDQSRPMQLDKEQQQHFSSSKDVAGQWKTLKKIDLSPRKVSSTHDKLIGQKKPMLPRQISAEDVAQILNPPKLSSVIKNGPPVPTTSKDRQQINVASSKSATVSYIDEDVETGPQEFCNDEVFSTTEFLDKMSSAVEERPLQKDCHQNTKGQKKVSSPMDEAAQLLETGNLTMDQSGPTSVDRHLETGHKEFCCDEVVLQTGLPNATEKQRTSATDISRAKNLPESVQQLTLTDGFKSSLKGEAEKSSQNNCPPDSQITFEDNVKLSMSSKDPSEVYADETILIDGKEVSKYSAPREDTSEADSSVSSSREKEVSEVSNSTSNRPIHSQLQPLSSETSKVTSEESTVLTSRQVEKTLQVSKSVADPSQPVSTNTISSEPTEELFQTDANDNIRITSPTATERSEVSRFSNKLSEPVSTPLQSTSSTNRISSEMNQKKRKTSSAPAVRETRSVAEKKNSILGPKRPWPTR
jgi:hypothetical protein